MFEAAKVELVVLEDLRLIDSGQSTIVRAGQRVRLTLLRAQKLLKRAPGAAALVPRVKPGVWVEWRTPDGARRGPALVRESFVDSTSGFTWLGIEWEQTEYLLREDQIVELPIANPYGVRIHCALGTRELDKAQFERQLKCRGKPCWNHLGPKAE